MSDEGNYTFNTDGTRTDVQFSQFLVENGVILPATYEVKWNAGASAWVGVLCGELSPNARDKSLEAARRKQRNVGN